MTQKVCIECKTAPARYWDENFCEKCIREVFTKESKVGENHVRVGRTPATN